MRGPETSETVQIDHVVALSDAWQTGAQALSEAKAGPETPPGLYGTPGNTADDFVSYTPTTLDFNGISGHAVMSTTVFPVMLSVVLLGAPALVRRAGFVAGLALGIMIGASRVAVKAHSISEIVAGCAIGALVACIFVSRLENREAQATTATPHPLLVSLSLIALIGALHGLHLPTQRWVTSLALDLSGHERPFIRARWHRDGRIAPKLVDNVSSARPSAPDS